MDLAIRATPAGSEGLGFSLMMSVRNLALYGTDWIGAKLLEQYHISFNSLVLLNSATTLLAVPLVLLLPKILVSKTDAMGYHEHPVASTGAEGSNAICLSVWGDGWLRLKKPLRRREYRTGNRRFTGDLFSRNVLFFPT